MTPMISYSPFSLALSHLLLGASINDAKIFLFFDPLPHLSAFRTEMCHKIHETSLTMSAFPSPPFHSPLECEHHIWTPPNTHTHLWGLVNPACNFVRRGKWVKWHTAVFLSSSGNVCPFPSFGGLWVSIPSLSLTHEYKLKKFSMPVSQKGDAMAMLAEFCIA